MTKRYYSNGKLLLTGEYAVLDGALALALPTTYGQSLEITPIESPFVVWKSLDEKQDVWYEDVLELHTLKASKKENPTTETLTKILNEAKKLNPEFLSSQRGIEIVTQLDFPQNWGLGSSSTLINNIAQWAGVDAYNLLWNSFSGSGYDIACAQHDHPISYRVENKKPIVEIADFNPSFKDRLYFVHLNRKQDSRAGIAQYRTSDFNKPLLVAQLSEITKKIMSCDDVAVFENLLNEHENLLSKALKIPTVKESYFPDFEGTIKSLGAWGGDFILAVGTKETPAYFKVKGFHTVISYKKMIL